MKEFIKNKIIGTGFEWESHIENIFCLLSSNLDGYNPKYFLDVGCGYGDRTIQIAKHFKIDFKNVHGVDYHEQQVTACKAIWQWTPLIGQPEHRVKL